MEVGIGVGAGVWHQAGGAGVAELAHRDICVRIVLELPDEPSAEAVQDETARLLGLLEHPGRE